MLARTIAASLPSTVRGEASPPRGRMNLHNDGRLTCRESTRERFRPPTALSAYLDDYFYDPPLTEPTSRPDVVLRNQVRRVGSKKGS
ncbi:hypothetical protein J6590_032545 [Homalodisca vitripennis]|nr:hypothetical protein J6590_032545 [Homalodisca vitripennis]